MPIIGTAGSPLLTTNLFQARSVQMTVPLQERHLCDRIQRYRVTVPANQSRLQILDQKALGGSDTIRYVYLESSVEGVSWWPIASTSPNVSPTTRPFGWIFDPAAPIFTHTHGVRSSTPADHLVTGSQIFHEDQFPTFWQVAEDATAPVAAADRYVAVKLDAPTPFIPFDSEGIVFDASVRASVGLGNADPSVLTYMIGMGSPMDLGEAGDSLEFILTVFSEDSLAFPRANMTVYSYPYTTTRLSADQIPATTPAGDIVWSSSDRNLCRNNLIPAINGDPFGFGVTTVVVPQQALAALAIPSGSVPTTPGASGLWAIRLTKDTAGETDGEVNDFSGAATYRRATIITLFMDRGLTGDDEAALPMYFGNIFFGPRVGFWRDLRPFDYFTAGQAAAGVASADKPWDTGDIPAVGILNPYGVSANVYIEVGMRSS